MSFGGYCINIAVEVSDPKLSALSKWIAVTPVSDSPVILLNRWIPFVFLFTLNTLYKG
jgi:hypothetical protein